MLRHVPTATELVPDLREDPLEPISHAGMALAAERARGHLEADRPWAAWKELRDHVEDPDDAPQQVALLAARAAAGWDGWSQVRRLLEGRHWLAERGRGEGAFLLARAEEERRGWADAAKLYRRYLDVRGGARVPEATVRLARALSAAGDHRGAAQVYASAAALLPDAGDWLRALEAESLSRAGDPAGTNAAAAASGGPARARHAAAEARAWLARGDTARAVERLAAEEQALSSADAAAYAAELALERAALLRGTGRIAESADALRRAAADARAARAVRLRAAALLGELPGNRTADEHLARAAAYEAGGRPGLAARALRSALKAGAADDPTLRLRLGRLLFEERDLRPSREALLDAADRLGDPAQAAEAELLAARALVRLGGDGYAEMRRLVERRPGTAAAGTAAYLLGDAADTRQASLAWYRRAAEATASPHAREAHYRLGDRLLKEKNPAAAAAAWEAMVGRHPSGELSAEAAYRAGVVHERAGREGRAREMYAAAIAADPVSYSAIRAADRMGADPLARALAAPPAWPAERGDADDANRALRRLDALAKTGLRDEWKRELEWQERRMEGRPGALLLLAEGLRDRKRTVEGIRMGRALLAERGGAWDERLLRVVFPFPYQELVRAEADRADVDPFLLAGLVRQESSFDPRARSWVGATGLSQIMPATGKWLAKGAGVRGWDPSLLAVPEINLRMGSRYLAEQLGRFGGRRDLALAAYNAGPGRAVRWRRELGYGGDPDAFRERIPFAETRQYVKLVLRNAVVYRRLYGGAGSPGLTARGS
ncbi:MAG TPA: lytic transglycosylase domain-containing protein [Longimicrobium sp.]|nr:lytic transglycosylase domain-containing protein [Longimicrobium sp.]